MKKSSFFAKLLSVLLIGAAPVVADDCYSQCWTPDCCDWSVCDGKFYVGADWLYWQAAQDDPICVYTDVTTETLETISPYLPNRKYNSGYRVVLGYELPCSCWEIGVSYLYLPMSGSFSVAGNVFAEGVFFEGELDSISSSLKFNLNQVDVDFARTICFGECFSLRPHAGFRALWGDEKIHSTIFDTYVTANDIEVASSIKDKWNAYGVEAGFDARWKFGCGLAIVGKASGSLLYAKHNVSSDLTIVAQPVGPDLIPATYSLNNWTGLPTVEYFLGLEYADSFCDFAFNIHAGWEQHYFFSFNRFYQCSNHGGMSLHGLTLGAGVSF